MEHLTDNKKFISDLMKKCQKLFVAVPYQEKLVPNGEHVNSYDDRYYEDIKEFKRCYVVNTYPKQLFPFCFHILKQCIKIIIRKPTVIFPNHIIFVFER
jgi:hypothetical protein